MIINDAELIHGDCIEAMRAMPDCSVDSCVTDAPYHLTSIVKRYGKTSLNGEGTNETRARAGADGMARLSRGFMGKVWDGGDIAFQPETWTEVLRVLKPGGHLLAFSGTRTQHRMVSAIEDAGFEIRDMIAWVYGTGFPKSHNLDGDWHGWGTALKPALEPITVARKPLNGTVAANVMEYGTGALNIDDSRIETETQLSRKNGSRKNQLYNSGTWKSGQFGSGDASGGRWPANLIHDGSDEVVGMFPQSTSTGGLTQSFAKNHRVYGNPGPDKLRANAGGLGDSGSAARFFYTAKASKGDRDDGLGGHRIASASERSGGRKDGSAGLVMEGGKANAYAGTTTPGRNVHPTVKPTDLMRYLCRLVTPPRGTVLDPFMGSGSTGMAAQLEGFKFIGCEMEQDYFDIACQRIRKAGEQPDMFLHVDDGLEA
ncbi:MAG: site-specific DNA-methyltransferase [Alphaproteobacteria bacterium]|nr:site-specific DNA-methyltransferase [Alphaproteobacteria bacterium]